MAEEGVGTITGGTVSSSGDLTIGAHTVGEYIIGGVTNLKYSWTVGTDGNVSETP
ncbi:hypothetical protein CVH13_00499, partial [Dehalococcoides mccartyi]